VLLTNDAIRFNTEYHYPNSKAMERRLKKLLKAQAEHIMNVLECDFKVNPSTTRFLIPCDRWAGLRKEIEDA